MGGRAEALLFLDFRGMAFWVWVFDFRISFGRFFPEPGLRPAAQLPYFCQKNKVTQQKLTLLPPTLRCAKGNLHHASHAVRCETPDALRALVRQSQRVR